VPRHDPPHHSAPTMRCGGSRGVSHLLLLIAQLSFERQHGIYFYTGIETRKDNYLSNPADLELPSATFRRSAVGEAAHRINCESVLVLISTEHCCEHRRIRLWLVWSWEIEPPRTMSCFRTLIDFSKPRWGWRFRF
jgi:hypothetical protein